MTIKRAYPRKEDIARVVDCARDKGIVVGSIEVTPDGDIRVYSAQPQTANKDWRSGSKLYAQG